MARKGRLPADFPSWMSAFEDGHPLVTGPNYLGIRRFDVSRHVLPVGVKVSHP